MIFLLTILSMISFIAPGGTSFTLILSAITNILFLATQFFTVQPGNTIIALNLMSNATFQCTCPDCTTPPYWTMENQGRHLSTNDDADKVILAQRGIAYSSSANTTDISIPDKTENNNTLLICAAFQFGVTEFSDPVTLTIIGESVIDSYLLIILIMSL